MPTSSPDTADSVESLFLGRDFTEPRINLDGKVILITGGTGSFGMKLVETILAEYQPRKVIIFSRDELKQYEMAQRFSPAEHPCLRYFIGDVRDGVVLFVPAFLSSSCETLRRIIVADVF